MAINRSKDVVTTFLSCSVRPRDWPLVDAVALKVLAPQGFQCFTVGRNVSLPEQSDDAISPADELLGVPDRRCD